MLLLLAMLTGLVGGLSLPALDENDVSAAPMGASALDVIISEVAWGGTSSSYTSDEWIELYNTTNSPIDLSGWTLAADDGNPSISFLSGKTIPAYGYFLLESSDDFTIFDITADQTYSGTLSNSGETLTLADNLSNTIDTANISGGAWDAGHTVSGPSYSSMERIGAVVDSASAWDANDGVTRNGLAADNSTPVNGTPHNSKEVDLSLTMSVNDTNPSIPVFTLTVSNAAGYDSATGVEVTNLLTSGLTYASHVGGGTYDNTTGIWAIGSLASGASQMLQITANAATSGTKTNLAEVSKANELDADSFPDNNLTTEDDYAFAKVHIPALADLIVTKSVNNATPNVGSNVVFTITVENVGSGDATMVEVKDSLPAGLTYVSDDGGVTYDNSTGIWTVGTLASSVSNTLQITAKVATNGTKINLAEVWQFDSLPGSSSTLDDQASVTVTPIGGQADLRLVHDPVFVSTSVAGQVTLTIKVYNDGPYDATGVDVKDLLPSGLTYLSYTASTGTTYSSGTGIWSVGNLLNGASKTLNLTVKAASSGTSTTNFAEVWQSDQYDPDSTPGNDSTTEDDDASLEVLVADLRLAESVNVAGSNAVFTITLRNDGPDDATGVKVKTGLPTLTSAYTFVSYGSTLGTYDSGAGVWTVGTLTDGAAATLTITTTTSGSLSVNWVEVSEVSAADQVDPDSVPNNNSRTEDDDAGAPAADLFLTQSVNNANPTLDSNVVFTITVSNAGIASTSGVQVKDLLPSGLAYVSDTGAGAYNKTSGIWAISGTLASGDSRTLTITAKVSALGIRTNWAEVWRSAESDPDSTPGNGSTTEDDDAGATITSRRSIIINEIAWGGTAASPNDEWIELYNPSNASINITGWTLRAASSGIGSLNITLSGSIAAGGYFLLEREDNSTVSDVSADQIYAGGLLNILSDAGEVLNLSDGSGNLIDTANNNGGGWPRGSLSPNYGTMERYGTSAESDSTGVTNIGNPKNGKNANEGNIYGTPKRVNSRGTALAPTSTPVVIRTPTPRPVGRPVINEFLPRPAFDWNQDGKMDVFDEFIEIKNIGPVDSSLGGWRLDDEANLGSDPFTLPSITLKPGERVRFYGLETNILLSDGGDTVRLLDTGGKIYDSYTYSIAKVEDESICRLPDGYGSWYEDCTPTPNLPNTRDGTVPSMPGGEAFESPVCALPDTLPADFLFAECRGYGANIWRAMYWDAAGWGWDRFVPANSTKWESFVE